MTKQRKLIAALTKRAASKPKLKAKIKAIKKRQNIYEWLAQ